MIRKQFATYNILADGWQVGLGLGLCLEVRRLAIFDLTFCLSYILIRVQNVAQDGKFSHAANRHDTTL